MDYKYQYKFTEKATTDLDEIISYIAVQLNSKGAASKFLDNVVETIEQICSFPELGKIVENEFLTRNDVRQIIIGNYILYYIPNSSERVIYILSILYGKRNLNDILTDFNAIQ